MYVHGRNLMTKAIHINLCAIFPRKLYIKLAKQIQRGRFFKLMIIYMYMFLAYLMKKYK